MFNIRTRRHELTENYTIKYRRETSRGKRNLRRVRCGWKDIILP